MKFRSVIPAAVARKPAVLTCAPLEKVIPSWFCKMTWPLAVILPAICDGFEPVTRFRVAARAEGWWKSTDCRARGGLIDRGDARGAVDGRRSRDHGPAGRPGIGRGLGLRGAGRDGQDQHAGRLQRPAEQQRLPPAVCRPEPVHRLPCPR